MTSTFGGISTALSGLMAARKAMDVTGQNITNANTPGYTRQRVDLQSTTATGVPSLYSNTNQAVGTGVTVAAITRTNDAFLDAAVNAQTSASSQASGRASTLTSLEQLTQEPTDDGIAGQLDDMFTSWQDLSNNPDDLAARTVVLTKSQAVVGALRSAHQSVEDLWTTEKGQLDSEVSLVNTTAQGVADLNKQITQAIGNGNAANDLQDQRDLLVKRLAGLTGATAQVGGGGSVTVLLGGLPLVAGDQAATLGVTTSPAGSAELGSTVGLVLTSGAASNSVSAGSLGGSTAAHLTALSPTTALGALTLAGAAKQYDDIAASLADWVNAVHTSGQDLAGTAGGAFFATSDGSSTITASNITVAITDPSKVAAAASHAAGVDATNDGANARTIGALGTAAKAPTGASLGNPQTVWNTYVASLGTQAATAAQKATTAVGLLQTASDDQQTGAGVSLDEETANLLVLQRSYQGAARIMSAVDDMISTIINMVGR